MDTSARDIYFRDDGTCNFCEDFLKDHRGQSDLLDQKLEEIVAAIRSAGANLEYDCIVGVSGGVDSSWALVQAVRHGLRPLAVHMDNGWNSELAQNNISQLVTRLGVDLHTHVIDWEEYRSLMQAFFDADVIDVELLYDNAMLGVNYFTARRFGIKYILAGTNHATEGVRIPEGWAWLKNDARNIRGIGRTQGVKLKTFPVFSTMDFFVHRAFYRIQWTSLLDYVGYNKTNALLALEREFAYKPYPYKHYESVFTRFYQGHILPTKFGVDKRRAHLSSLILSGEIGRDQAVELLLKSPYPSATALTDDVVYFCKKMRWSQSDLSEYLARPEVRHDQFPSEARLWQLMASVYQRVRRS